MLPGEVVDVEITAYVGDKAAFELNLGPKELEWTFVVHTIYGRDSFVGVTATYGKLIIFPCLMTFRDQNPRIYLLCDGFGSVVEVEGTCTITDLSG